MVSGFRVGLQATNRVLAPSAQDFLALDRHVAAGTRVPAPSIPFLGNAHFGQKGQQSLVARPPGPLGHPPGRGVPRIAGSPRPVFQLRAHPREFSGDGPTHQFAPQSTGNHYSLIIHGDGQHRAPCTLLSTRSPANPLDRPRSHTPLATRKKRDSRPQLSSRAPPPLQASIT